MVVGRFFGAYGLFPAPIWLPAGIAAIACMVGGSGLLPGIFLGSLAVNAGFFGTALPVAAMISATNALGPWAGVQLTRLMRPPSGLFTRFSGVLGFILGAVLLHAALTAAGGTLALALAEPMSFSKAYAVFSAWWLCDSGGTFFFAPALLLWLGAERTPPRRTASPPRWIRWCCSAMGWRRRPSCLPSPASGKLVRPDVVFLLTVPLSWITLRISLRAAYTLLTLICLAATVGTVIGEGPSRGRASPIRCNRSG